METGHRDSTGTQRRTLGRDESARQNNLLKVLTHDRLARQAGQHGWDWRLVLGRGRSGAVESRYYVGADEVGKVGSVKDRGRSQRLVETLSCQARVVRPQLGTNCPDGKGNLTTMDEFRRLGREDFLRDPRFRVGLFGEANRSRSARQSRRLRAHLVVLHDPFKFDDTDESKDAQVLFDLLVRRPQEELQRQKKSVSNSSQRTHVAKTNLIQLERRSHRRVEPDRVPGALAKFFARRGREEREGQAERRILLAAFCSLDRLSTCSPLLGRVVRPPDEVDTGHDVAQLVGSAELHRATDVSVKAEKVVGLQ